MQKWEWVAEDLRDRIVAGEFPEGSFLPIGPDLMREYEVGAPTIYRARVFLRKEGLIRTHYDNGSHTTSRRCTVIYNKELDMSNRTEAATVVTNDAMTREDSNEFLWAGFLIGGRMKWVQNYDPISEEELFPGHQPLIVCTSNEFNENPPAPDVVVPVRP